MFLRIYKDSPLNYSYINESLILEYLKSFKDGFNLKNIFGKQLIDASATNYIQSIFDQIEDGSLKVNTLAKSTSKLDQELVAYIKTSQDGTRTTEDFNKYISLSGKSLTKLSVSSKIAKIGVAALNATLTMGASLLASFVIEGVVSWIDDVTHKSEKLAEAAQESIEKIQDLKDSLKSDTQFVNDNAQRFAELSQGVSEFGSNQSLSTDDYAEFLNISNQLADIFPTLDRVYDDNGNAIVQLRGNVDDIVGSLQILIETQKDLTNANIAASLPTIFENASNKSKQFDIDLDELDKQRNALIESANYIRNYDFTQSLDDQWIEITDLDTDALYVVKDAYEQALKDAKVEFEALSTTMGVDELGMQVPIGFTYRIVDEVDDNTKKQVESAISQVVAQYEDGVDEIDKKISNINSQKEQTWNSLNRSIASWLYTNSEYKVLDDNAQAVVQQMVDEVQWDQLDFSSWEEAQGYISNNILDVFTGDTLPDRLKERLLTSLQQGELSDNDYVAVVQKLQNDINDYFEDNGIDVKLDLNFLIADQKDAETRFKNHLNGIANNNSTEQWKLNQFAYQNSIDTASEKEYFMEVTLGANTAQEAIDMYTASLVEADKWSNMDLSPIHESLDQIQSAYQTVSEAIDEYNTHGCLSLDTVQEIINLDDKYLTFLYDENGQLTLNAEAYNELTRAKLELMKIGVINNALDLVEGLESEEAAAQYLKDTNIDLTNVNWELFESNIALAESELALLGDTEQVTQRQAALDSIVTSTKARIQAINDAINSVGSGQNNSYVYTGKSTTKEAEKFDWIENSVNNASQAVDRLNEKISNATGFKQRIGLYDQLIEADNKYVQTTKQAANAYEQEWIKASSKISSEYKNKIVSGDTFEIEKVKNETSAKNIKEAQEAYKNWQSMLDAYNKAIQQKKDDDKAKVSTLLEQEEAKLAILELDNLDSMNAKQKNAHIEKEAKIKKNIYDYELQLAETSEEKLRLEKEYQTYLKENEKKIYENNKEERDNKIHNYDTKIQDVQNAIALAEAQNGSATIEQHEKINSYYDEQIALHQENIDAAKAMRDASKPNSKEWMDYNDQIQEAQNHLNATKIAQLENNKAMLLLPVKQYEKMNDELQEQLDNLGKCRGKVENAIGYASTLVQDQIDLLNENKESVSDYYDAQIKPLEEQKEALTESNDEIQRNIDLQNAKYNLEKALNNKSVRIYKKGEGFVYEADQEEIRTAQQELDQQLYENEIASLDSAINTLNKQKESEIETIDKKIEAWEDYAKQIEKVTGSYERLIAMQDLIANFGTDAIAKILSQDASILTNFETTLNGIKTAETDVEARIEANTKVIESIQKEAEAYVSGAKDIVTARQNIDNIVANNQDEVQAITNRTVATGTYAGTWTQTEKDIITALGGVETANITAKNNEKTTLGEREENLRLFKEKALWYYNEIATAVTSAQTSLSSLQTMLNDAKTTYESIVDYSNKANGSGETYVVNGEKLNTYHDGGIVGKDIGGKKLPDFLMSLANSPLKPNETLAKLLNGEVVLNATQMHNIFDNLSKVSVPLTQSAINKTTPSMSVSVGDVHVHNPNNSDMIVNEIVKELPLKVIQRLNSK